MIFMCISVLKITRFACSLWGWAWDANIGKHFKFWSSFFYDVFLRLIHSTKCFPKIDPFSCPPEAWLPNTVNFSPCPYSEHSGFYFLYNFIQVIFSRLLLPGHIYFHVWLFLWINKVLVTLWCISQSQTEVWRAVVT